MTRDWFDRQLSRLASLPNAPADTDGHWDALQDLPPQLFEAAISHALRTRAWFPVPVDLRRDCDAVSRRAVPSAVAPTSHLVPVDGQQIVTIRNPFGGADITLAIDRAYRADCDDCDDSGQVVFWCGAEKSTRWPWLYRRACERRDPHAAHDWAGTCPCVATNATIQRRRAAQGTRYAQDPERAA